MSHLSNKLRALATALERYDRLVQFRERCTADGPRDPGGVTVAFAWAQQAPGYAETTESVAVLLREKFGALQDEAIEIQRGEVKRLRAEVAALEAAEAAEVP